MRSERSRRRDNAVSAARTLSVGVGIARGPSALETAFGKHCTGVSREGRPGVGVTSRRAAGDATPTLSPAIRDTGPGSARRRALASP